jgi:hypothetical protein
VFDLNLTLLPIFPSDWQWLLYVHVWSVAEITTQSLIDFCAIVTSMLFGSTDISSMTQNLCLSSLMPSLPSRNRQLAGHEKGQLQQGHYDHFWAWGALGYKPAYK